MKSMENIKTKKEILSKVLNNDDKDIYHNDDTLSFGKLFIQIFNSLYSLYTVDLHEHIDKDKFLNGLKKNYKLPKEYILRYDYIYNRSKKKNSDSKLYQAFLILKHGLAVGIGYRDISIYYSCLIKKTEVLEIVKFSEKFKIPICQKREFHMVTRLGGGFDLENFEIKEYSIDIETNYNDDFNAIHELITKTLSDKSKNGILLLHGVYGSGKTYYIRYLINVIKRKFIYIPLNMANWLSDPDFIPFLTKFRDSVIILEDCESLLMHRDDGNPNANVLSNLLNFGDGLLADAFSINIICTFNTNLKKIDDALLRKGRLIARYEFKELEITKAQALADKLNKKILVEKPMTLTDIYNAESMKFENKKAYKIGFAIA